MHAFVKGQEKLRQNFHSFSKPEILSEQPGREQQAAKFTQNLSVFISLFFINRIIPVIFDLGHIFPSLSLMLFTSNQILTHLTKTYFLKKVGWMDFKTITQKSKSAITLSGNYLF